MRDVMEQLVAAQALIGLRDLLEGVTDHVQVDVVPFVSQAVLSVA